MAHMSQILVHLIGTICHRVLIGLVDPIFLRILVRLGKRHSVTLATRISFIPESELGFNFESRVVLLRDTSFLAFGSLGCVFLTWLVQIESLRVTCASPASGACHPEILRRLWFRLNFSFNCLHKVSCPGCFKLTSSLFFINLLSVFLDRVFQGVVQQLFSSPHFDDWVSLNLWFHLVVPLEEVFYRCVPVSSI